MKQSCMHSELDTGFVLQNTAKCFFPRSDQKVTSPRLVDTAQRYGCEQFLAVAIQESKLKREELFLTDKVFLESKQADRHISLIQGLARQLRYR